MNIAELVRVRREEIDKRIGHVEEAEVLRLRGNLLPLIRLERALSDETADDDVTEATDEQAVVEAINIIVLETGQQRFGVIVDGLHDSEEIVVKPLGRHIKDCPCLSGATILGDGHVALILDVTGIANHEQIQSAEDATQEDLKKAGYEQEEDSQFMLLFSNHPTEHFAISMDVISRIERIRADQIDSVGGHELLQYRDSTMSLLRLENCITAKPPEPNQRLYVVVFEVAGNEVGLVATNTGRHPQCVDEYRHHNPQRQRRDGIDGVRRTNYSLRRPIRIGRDGAPRMVRRSQTNRQRRKSSTASSSGRRFNFLP